MRMIWRFSLPILILAIPMSISPSSTFAQEINKLKAGVVRIENVRLAETGTGFIVKIDGNNVYIVTASHVVRGDQHPKVYLFNQQHESISATLLDREEDDNKGLALLLLKTNAQTLSGLTALKMGYTSDLGNGESVKIVGFPGGTSLWTVDTGNIKRLEGRNLVLSGAIKEGNSGGPVILNEQAVGLVTDVGQSEVYATRAEVIIPYVNGIVKNLIAETDSTQLTQEPIGVPRKIVILIADFKSLNEQNYAVTEILLEKLRDATKDYSDVEVKSLNFPITAQQGSAEAIAKGKEQRASIVLWGWYTKTKEKLLIDVHCQFLQKPKNLVLLKEGQTLLLPGSQLESFELQMRLAGEMTYLTLLTVGLARLEAEDYDGAIARFTAALNQRSVPDSMINPADVYYFRGVAAFLKRYFAGKIGTDTATSDFDKAIETDPHKTKAQLFRGIIFVLNEQYEKAILDFSRVIERESENGLAYLCRAFTYKQKGEERLASVDLVRAMRILGTAEGDPAADQILRAYGYFLNRDFDKAIAELNKALKPEPDNAVYLLMFRAIIYGLKENYDAALLDLDRAIGMNASLPLLYALRGAFYDENGNHDKAIADFDRSIKLNPADPDLYLWRGDSNASKGSLAEAIEDYNTALKLNPAYVDAYSARARVFEKRGDYPHAIADYGAIINLQPDNIEAYNDRAQFYEKREDYARAIADYDEMIRRKPLEAEYFFSRGFLYNRKGEIDQAIEDYTKAIALSSKEASFYKARARAYESKSDLDRAIGDYTEALKLDSGEADTYIARAQLFERKDLADRALADYNQAIKIEPKSELPRLMRSLASARYVTRGLEEERGDNSVEAIRYFDLAIKFSPENGWAYAVRGSAHQEIGKADLAFQDYNRAIELEPKNPGVFTIRADGYKKKNEFVLAMRDYDSAILLTPNDPELYLKRADMYDRLGMIDQAVVDYERALKIKPSFNLARLYRDESGLKYLTNGLDYKMKGDLDKAIGEYNKSIKLRPNAPEAYLYRAEIFAIRNDDVHAIADLRVVIQIATDVALRRKAEDLLRQIESKGPTLKRTGSLEQNSRAVYANMKRNQIRLCSIHFYPRESAA